MLINYDPKGTPKATPELLRDAEEYRLQIIHIICLERGARAGDPSGVSFLALAPFIPARGDRIDLEDGRSCEVERVYHKVAPMEKSEGKIKSIALVPNVVAYLLPDKI